MAFFIAGNSCLPILNFVHLNNTFPEIIIRSADQIGKLRVSIIPEREETLDLVGFLPQNCPILVGRLINGLASQSFPQIRHQYIFKEIAIGEGAGHAGLRV